MSLLLVALATSCSGPDMFVIGPDGSQHLRASPIMLGGKRTVMYRHEDRYGGSTRIAITQNNERSFDSFVAALAAAAALIVPEWANVQQAEDILKASVSNNQIAAGVTKAQIDAAVKQAAIQATIQRQAIREGITILPR